MCYQTIWGDTSLTTVVSKIAYVLSNNLGDTLLTTVVSTLSYVLSNNPGQHFVNHSFLKCITCVTKHSGTTLYQSPFSQKYHMCYQTIWSHTTLTAVFSTVLHVLPNTLEQHFSNHGGLKVIICVIKQSGTTLC